MDYLLSFKDVCKSYGDKKILSNFNFHFRKRMKLGVLGRNGAGKSTILKLIIGNEIPDSGVFSRLQSMNLEYVSQEPYLDNNLTVHQHIYDCYLKDLMDLLVKRDEILMAMNEPHSDDKMVELLDEFNVINDRITEEDVDNISIRVKKICKALNCPDESKQISKLSGGERMRIALACALVKRHDLLLLDEPTNHLDLMSIQWLTEFIRKAPYGIMVVSHNRTLLDNCVDGILEMDVGTQFYVDGNYSKWIQESAKRKDIEMEYQAKLSKLIIRESEWANQSPKARETKNKARIANYHDLLHQRNMNPISNTAFPIANTPYQGKDVLSVNKISKIIGSRTLFKNMSFTLSPGSIVGICGPNGVGKTTLLNIIAGLDTPTDGEVKLGDTTKVSYLDQMQKDIDYSKTVYEFIAGGRESVMLGSKAKSIRAVCSELSFKKDDQQKPISVLSGGERSRVYMTKKLLEEANFRILDEPTNHLDLPTISAVEESIESCYSTVLLVSHDEKFLNICTHILFMFEDGFNMFIEGNYNNAMDYHQISSRIDILRERYTKVW